jgi:hypothetical protein
MNALVDRGPDRCYKVKVLAPASVMSFDFGDSGDAGSGKSVSDR